MDGTGSVAQIAACIVRKDWDMLRGILVGVGDHETLVRSIILAARCVPEARLAEFIISASEKE